jgi:uncharacterized alkaline shock family protein YloU
VIPPEFRGWTEIAARVPERIAGRTIAEADEASGVSRRVLGVPIGRRRAAPRVQARIDGNLVILRVTVSVVYPAPVRQVAGRLRERVTARITELTGLRVGQVDVDVTALLPAGRTGLS